MWRMNTATVRIARACALALVLCPVIAAAQAQATPKTPVTHEALWLMKRVGAPAPSPDGTWVVFSVTEPAYDEKKEVVRPLDRPRRRQRARRAGSPRPRAARAARPGAPTAGGSPSPPSARTTRSRQIYVHRRGRRRRGAAGHVVSPGRPRRRCGAPTAHWIALPGRGLPRRRRRRGEQEDRRRAQGREVEGAGLRDLPHPPLGQVARRHPDPPVRRRRRRRGERPRPAGRHAARRGSPASAAPAAKGRREDLAPTWAPDGRSVVFAATTNRNAAAYAPVNTHLYEVPVAGRRAARAHHRQRRPTRAPRSRPTAGRCASASTRSGAGSTPSTASPARPGRGRGSPSDRDRGLRPLGRPTSPSRPTAARSTSPRRTRAS